MDVLLLNKEIELDAQQTAAINLATDLAHRLVSVSGPAGSGKTTIIRLIYEQLVGRGISVALAAPTGKAARRIREATGIGAVTVHKLLGYGRPGERDLETGKPLDPTLPSFNRGNPLPYQVVIVDEYAMINYELHDNLMAALPSGGCVRAFGDVNQLPPIEPYRITDNGGRQEPTPFEKLLARTGDSIKLDKVYRQGEGSSILAAADQIRKGHTPTLNQDLGELYIKITDQPINLLSKYVQNSGVDFTSIRNQIISPSRKSWVGTHQLNDILRNLLNPTPVQTLDLPRHAWDKQSIVVGLGDKVVCTENSYDLRDYFERFAEWTKDMTPILSSFIPTPDNKQMLNGETGIITQIYPDGAMDIDFGDRIVEVPSRYHEYWAKKDTVIEVEPLRAIDLAYALTTHKCQGSEYDEIIYVLNKTTLFTQSRQNFYTGLTRAKKRALVLADQRSMRTSVFVVKK
jgi:exodeoxyribonuclease V alpha subunit